MVRKLLIVATVVLALSLASMFLPARQMNIEGIGQLSFESKVVLAANDSGNNYKYAYQVSIPEGVGSETGLQVFPATLQTGGSQDNWLAASRRDMDIPMAAYTRDEQGDIMAADKFSPQAQVSYIRQSDNRLTIKAGALSNKCQYDIEIPDYTIYGGEPVTPVKEGGETITPLEEGSEMVTPTKGGGPKISELRVKFDTYVYGSGSDLYQLEDVPQNGTESRLHGITGVRVYTLVKAQSGATEATAATRIGIGENKFDGQPTSLDQTEKSIVTVYATNPVTGAPWTWPEINVLEAGVTLKDGICYFVYVEVECLVGSQTFFPVTPVECTPGTANSWQSVDLDTYVSGLGSDVTGVILHIVDNYPTYGQGFYRAVGFRKNGSTDNRTDLLYARSHFWGAIGVDSNHVFQCYVGDTTYIDFYIVGYTRTGVTFFTNAYDKSLATANAWVDINCAAQAPNAIGLIFEETQVNYDGNYIWGLRNNGSGDSRIYDSDRHAAAIIGCDSSRVCEGRIGTGTVGQIHFWLVGFVTDGATFYTTATDLSFNQRNRWRALSTLPAGAVMGFIEVISGNYQQNFGLRENGSSESIIMGAAGEQHSWGIVKCDASRIIEGNIDNTAVDFFLVGYATSPSTADISNTPSSKNFGVVSENSFYWANGTTPTFPLQNSQCYFTLTNRSSVAVNIVIRATNFTGGVGWALAGTPGANIVTLKAGRSGDAAEGNMLTLTTSNQSFISGLAASTSRLWELKLETGTFTDELEKSSTITLTATSA